MFKIKNEFSFNPANNYVLEELSKKKKLNTKDVEAHFKK